MRSAFLAGLLCSLATPGFCAVWEKTRVPDTWSLIDKPSRESTMSLSIALTRKNLDRLDATLAKLSTPGHAEYGQWLEKEDIEKLFPVADHRPVVSWLRGAGISHISREGALITFHGTVDQVNRLLETDFAYYHNGASTKLRTTQYSIPDHLADHIDLVSPTVHFGKTSKFIPVPPSSRELEGHGASSTSVSPSCETSITPSCMKQMYNVGDYTPDPSAGSRIAFGSFLNQSASYADLAQYEALFNIPPQSFTVETLNGGVNNQSASVNDVGEANLDVQLIAAVAHPLKIHEYITGGLAPFIPDADEPTAADNSNEPYLTYYEYLLFKDRSEVPHVISNSYGEDEQTVPEKYARRVCDLIGLNGLRGISILHSSGDEGVGSACQAQDRATPQFNPIFPATCPYVTSVGGTSAVSPEVAWNASSGGFSNYFHRTWYQQSAVQTYLDSLPASAKEYYSQFADFEGRGFPDVSAHSLYPRFEVIYGGQKYGSGGTSAAAPVVAGIVGLLNDARLRAGKPVLGFLNPFFYLAGYKALNDITEGGSYGCTGINPQTGQEVDGGIIPGAHWNATEGWDPVTGLGTPDFQKLKDLVLSF